MKYLIGNKVINADHIVEVRYAPETPESPNPGDRPSVCHIETINDGVSGFEFVTRLRGEEADLFWDAYSKDAYFVFNPKSKSREDAR